MIPACRDTQSGQGCHTEGPSQAGGIDQQEPHEIYQGQIPSAAPGQEALVQGHRLVPARQGAALQEGTWGPWQSMSHWCTLAARMANSTLGNPVQERHRVTGASSSEGPQAGGPQAG